MTWDSQFVDHWYEFIHDGQTGAVIDNVNHVIKLHFKDGERGDDDLTADGILFDMGGPAKIATDNKNGDSGNGGGSGGCFVGVLGRPFISNKKLLN